MSSKSEDMKNKIPLDDVIERGKENEKVRKELEEKHARRLWDINHSHFNRFMFHCVVCGDEVTAADVARCMYSVRLVVHRDCELKEEPNPTDV